MIHGKILTRFFIGRMMWINGIRVNLVPQAQEQLGEYHEAFSLRRKEYLDKINIIKNIDDPILQAKEFYAATNSYRNGTYKEINKSESLILKALRTSSYHKHPELKRELGDPFFQGKKNFNTQDGYLKSKVGEILTRKN
jgi:hypothetical protein